MYPLEFDASEIYSSRWWGSEVDFDLKLIFNFRPSVPN
jgi:hypothetical protein